MCIAFLTTKKQGLPDDKTLRHIFKSNPDGAGYVSVYTPSKSTPRMMRMEKGIMGYEDFETKIKTAFDLMTDDSDYIVAHTRIATSGGVSATKTHPFRMSDGSYLFHNGVTTGVSRYMDKSESDTEWLAKHTGSIKDIKLYDGTSRFLIVRPNGKVEMTDNWVKDTDGRLWTNTGYKPYEYPYGQHWSHGRWAYDDYDDYDQYGAFRGFGGHTTPHKVITPPGPNLTPPVIIVDDGKCEDGSCTINKPYTRRDFARYELLKMLSRVKTMSRIERTLDKYKLEYDREANAWFSDMYKVRVVVKGGNVSITKLTPPPVTSTFVPALTPLDGVLENLAKQIGDEKSDVGSKLLKIIEREINNELTKYYGAHYDDFNRLYDINSITLRDDRTFKVGFSLFDDPTKQYDTNTYQMSNAGVSELVDEITLFIDETYFS